MSSVYRWLIGKARGTNEARLQKMIDVMARETGKSERSIRLAMYRAAILHGVGFTDFFRSDYLTATKEQKATFVTTKSFYRLLQYLNDSEYRVVLHDKLVFNGMFKAFLKRGYVNLREISQEDFKRFLAGKDVVFAKSPCGFGGHGVTRVECRGLDHGLLYEDLKSKGQFLVEDAIEQCKEIDRMNPNSVASFRVVTLFKDGRAHVIANALRINQGTLDVIGCADDLYFSLREDGRIDSNVVDDFGTVYREHPLTHVRFEDVVIPGAGEAFDMCRRAALLLPQVRYIGWDIAFSKDGPVIMEGNEYPGYGIVQFTRLHGSRTGHLADIAAVLGDEMDRIKL